MGERENTDTPSLTPSLLGLRLHSAVVGSPRLKAELSISFKGWKSHSPELGVLRKKHILHCPGR